MTDLGGNLEGLSFDPSQEVRGRCLLEYPPRFGLISVLILTLCAPEAPFLVFVVVCFGFSFSFSLHEELRNFFPFGSLSLTLFTMQI